MNNKKYLFSQGVPKLVEDMKERSSAQSQAKEDDASIRGEL